MSVFTVATWRWARGARVGARVAAGLRPANITVVTWRWAATMHGRPLGLGLAGPEPQGRRRCQGGPYAMEIRERGEEQSGLNAG